MQRLLLLLLLLLANGQRVNQTQNVCLRVCVTRQCAASASSLVTDHPIGRQADAAVIKTLNERRVAKLDKLISNCNCYVLPATCYLLLAACYVQLAACKRPCQQLVRLTMRL